MTGLSRVPFSARAVTIAGMRFHSTNDRRVDRVKATSPSWLVFAPCLRAKCLRPLQLRERRHFAVVLTNSGSAAGLLEEAGRVGRTSRRHAGSGRSGNASFRRPRHDVDATLTPDLLTFCLKMLISDADGNSDIQPGIHELKAVREIELPMGIAPPRSSMSDHCRSGGS